MKKKRKSKKEEVVGNPPTCPSTWTASRVSLATAYPCHA